MGARWLVSVYEAELQLQFGEEASVVRKPKRMQRCPGPGGLPVCAGVH